MSGSIRHNLNRLSYFVAIIEEGTITAAAKRLGLSKAVVSKHLQLLEEEVGVSLLVRNTRHIHPTDAGNAFYLRSKEVLIQADEAFESLLEAGKEPTGHIRVTATIDLGVYKVAQLVTEFGRDYPGVGIDLVLTDDQIDIVEQRFDMAFRVGWLRDSSNRARKLSDFNEIVVCEPKTAKKYAVESPADLASIPFISYQGLPERSRVFSRRSKQRKVKLHSVITMNVISALRHAVRSGDCFTIVPDFTVESDLAKKNSCNCCRNGPCSRAGSISSARRVDCGHRLFDYFWTG
jgi:DNA-binding transcriptional LysR family regulator